MIVVRQATEKERALIMHDYSFFSGPIPDRYHLTREQVYDLCGIDWRKIKEDDERENEAWRQFSYESLRRILVRDGELDE